MNEKRPGCFKFEDAVDLWLFVSLVAELALAGVVGNARLRQADVLGLVFKSFQVALDSVVTAGIRALNHVG